MKINIVARAIGLIFLIFGLNIICSQKELSLKEYFSLIDGDLAFYKSLIISGFNLNSDFDGATMLHIVCRKGYLDICKLLIENGGDVNAVDNSEMTPLHLACFYGVNLDICKLLIENGANVNAVDDSGNTPLHLACNVPGSLEVCKLLILNGSNINAVDDSGNTPLHWASEIGNLDVCELILNAHKH